MPYGRGGTSSRDERPAASPVENLGQRGPRGPQPAQTVHPAPLRALFHSRWAVGLFRVALVGLLAAVTVLSLVPAPDVMSVGHVDKVMHFAAYAGVAGLAVLSRWMGWVWAVVFATLWGVGIEVLQGLAGTGRHASVADMVANAVGAGFGALIARWLGTPGG